MRTLKKRARKLMRTRNRDRVNRNHNQHRVLSPLFILVLIKWQLDGLTAAQVLQRLRYHISLLTGNADFPVVDPTLVDLGAKADALEVAIAEAQNGDRLKEEARDNLQAEAEEMLRSLAWDIQKKSDGNATKIHSTGFGTRDEKTPPSVPVQVINLAAKSTGEGKIKLRWKKVPNAQVYFIEMSQGSVPVPPEIWNVAGKSFKVSFELTDLVPGQMYYFRVYAANHVGDGEPSEVANARCL